VPDQEPLIPGRPTDDGGLYRRYLTNGHIDHHAWLRARAEHAPVGTCRRCAAHLTPERPYEHAGRTDYTATCEDPACGYVLEAPGGRVMRGSAAWSKGNGAGRAAQLAIAAKQQRKEATD
jgi:hypothetical protein